MASKRDHPAPVLLLSPSPVPPSTTNHHPTLSHPLPATHLALPTATQGLLAPQGHTGPAFLPGRERFIWLQVQGQQALGRGVLGSRLLGGSGRQWGEAGQGHGVFPSQDAGSRWEPSLGPRWQRALGMQAGRRGAGSCGPHSHHLMRVKMEVPTLRGSHVSRRRGRAAGWEDRLRAHLVAFHESLRDRTSSRRSHMVSSVSFLPRSMKHWCQRWWWGLVGFQ